MSAQSTPTPESRIKAALWFAERGFGVFTVWSATVSGVCRCRDGAACQSPGKHPVTDHGFQDATRDPERIRVLLLAGSNPNYGLVNPEGVFAWDLDGSGWRDRMADLESRLGPLPPTLTTQTANGEHRFFRWPDGYPRPIGQLFGWVTRWGSGRDAGYVIGPRSIHPSGREYAPGSVFEIATLPERWAEAILEELRPATTFTVTAGGYQLPDWGYGGSRYDAIRNYMASRYMRGLERDEIWQGVTGVLAPRFAELLSEGELRGRFDRAWDKMPERLGPPKEPPEEQVNGEVRRREDEGELGFLPPPAAGEFPSEPDAVAFEGLLGECVGDLVPGTDASLIGLLGSVLAFAGSYVPGQALWKRTNTSSPFVALVGESGLGGKGTAMIRIRDAFQNVWPEIPAKDVLLGGLNSGEALVATLDGRRKFSADAIGLLFEEEYARLLVARQREGSSIDFMMRVAFDGGSLENRKVAGSLIVAPPYWLSALIGITPTELGKRLEPGALQSGSANRWLYLAVRRRVTGEDGSPPRFRPARNNALRDARSRILRQPNPLELAPEVRRQLDEYGRFLLEQSVGIAADLTRRLDVIAMRIALIHALVEQDTTIRVAHLERALAVTEYGRRSLPWVFRTTLGDPIAELIYRHLLNDGPLSNRRITREICRDPQKRTEAIDTLIRLRMVERRNVSPHGRARSVLAATPQEAGWTPFRAPVVTVVHVSDKAPEEDTDDSRTASGTTAGQHGDNGVTTAGQHGDKLRQQGWVAICQNYTAHLNDHAQLPDGWYCRICNPELS